MSKQVTFCPCRWGGLKSVGDGREGAARVAGGSGQVVAGALNAPLPTVNAVCRRRTAPSGVQYASAALKTKTG